MIEAILSLRDDALGRNLHINHCRTDVSIASAIKDTESILASRKWRRRAKENGERIFSIISALSTIRTVHTSIAQCFMLKFRHHPRHFTRPAAHNLGWISPIQYDPASCVVSCPISTTSETTSHSSIEMNQISIAQNLRRSTSLKMKLMIWYAEGHHPHGVI